MTEISPIQALQLLASAVPFLKATKEEHILFEKAIQVLAKELQPSPVEPKETPEVIVSDQA